MVQNLLQKRERCQTNSSRPSIKSILLTAGSDLTVLPACQSKFDWFTFCQRLLGPTAPCLLIPAQGATWPTHPELNWSLGEASRSAGGRSKNKTLALSVRCRGRWGFPHHLRWLKMQPLPVVRRGFYLGDVWFVFPSEMLLRFYTEPAEFLPLWPLESHATWLKSKGTRGKVA